MDSQNREGRRQDPVLRDKVEDVLNARAEAAAEALRLVRQASAVMSTVGMFDDNALFNRSKSAIQSAETRLASDFRVFAEGKTDIYIENMAAGELGDIILRMGEDFEKVLPNK